MVVEFLNSPLEGHRDLPESTDRNHPEHATFRI